MTKTILLNGNARDEQNRERRAGDSFVCSDTFAAAMVNDNRAAYVWDHNQPANALPAQYAINPSNSNVLGLLGPSGQIIRSLDDQYRSDIGLDFWSPDAQSVVPTVTNATNITGGNGGVTLSYETINGERFLVATATVTADGAASFHLAWNTPQLQSFSACALTAEFIFDYAHRWSIGGFLSLDGAYSAYSQFGNRALNGGNQGDIISCNGLTAFTWHQDRLDNNSLTGIAESCSTYGQFTVGKLAISLNPIAGTRVFKLRSFRVTTAPRRARIALVHDDGPRSFFNRGSPILARYGFRSTCGVIRPAVEGATLTGLYANLAELKRFVDAGNACVAHGPNGAITGNVYSGALAGGATAELNAARVANCNLARDYLIANGLCTDQGAKCFVWPQGYWNADTGETSLLDAMYAAGYRLGRSASMQPSSAAIGYPGTGNPIVFNNFRGWSRFNYMRLICSIQGHSRAATDVLEQANIAKLCHRVIPDLAASGMDGILMFHDVVPNGTATLTTEIEPRHLEMICAAIKAHRDTLDVVLLEDFINYS